MDFMDVSMCVIGNVVDDNHHIVKHEPCKRRNSDHSTNDTSIVFGVVVKTEQIYCSMFKFGIKCD